MADTVTVQLNPVGMSSTTEGYISSVTVYTSGGATAKTPDGTGKIVVSPAAATALCTPDRGGMKLVSS